jgi:integrase
MFKRALRLGLVVRNPVTGIPKHKEPGARIVYLTASDEDAILDALAENLRPMLRVALNTGLRWSEQKRLRWGDVGFLTGTLTIRFPKHGHTRQIPINATVRQVLLDLATRRQRPADPEEPVLACPYREAAKFFPQTIARAQDILRRPGQDPSRLEGFTWHGLRHTVVSRVVMAGVDLRTVQELGGFSRLTPHRTWVKLGVLQVDGRVTRWRSCLSS